MHGEGSSSVRPADEVVSIIKSKGGTAVPNYGEVFKRTVCVCVCVCVCVVGGGGEELTATNIFFLFSRLG